MKIKSKFTFRFSDIISAKGVTILSSLLAVIATGYFLKQNEILAYGDAESHINIAKRVVDSITPGFAQLGGVWLPLPHLLMVPFVAIDPLWRTGLAGSIVSGVAFIISSVYIFKLCYLITNNKYASFFAFLVFALNPNILYLQSTPMTELPLISFFILSTYYFVRYIKSKDNIMYLMSAALFAMCAALSRYDGWMLVLVEAAAVISIFLPYKGVFAKLQSRFILFSTLAFFGIFMWLGWDLLILGDPLYFTNSIYSAKSQQYSWLAKGLLPTYHNPVLSFLYYFVTSLSITGIIVFSAAIFVGIIFFFFATEKRKYYIILLLLVPFIFYWVTLYMGQSVIFIPYLTPENVQYRLFNVRYGIMMLPFVAFMLGFAYAIAGKKLQIPLALLLVLQIVLFVSQKQPALAISDGTEGLSANIKKLDAQYWLTNNYDGGMVLLDDYRRTLSIVKSNIPMHEVINVGTKPYYQESFVAPEKYATWIILQRNDDVWDNLYTNPVERGRLYKYFHKVYTSEDILIFKRSENVATIQQ